MKININLLSNKNLKNTMLIDKEYLRNNPNHIFVFGDNLLRRGKAGAAALRDEPNTYGFITKKYPSNRDDAFYKPMEYRKVFSEELAKLDKYIKSNPDKIFLLSKVGAGLANKYGIYKYIIEPVFTALEKEYNNVKFLE
jgi:hypothetical protein